MMRDVNKIQGIDVFTEIFVSEMIDEVKRARQKFPINKHVLTAFNEEVGELNKAMIQNTHDGAGNREVWEEAIQAAAMALRVATEGDHSFDYDPITILSENIRKSQNTALGNRNSNT